MAQAVHSSSHEIPDRMRSGVFVVLLLTVVLAIAATYLGAERLLIAQSRSVAQGQHALYLRSLNETIGQHQHLPFILSQNPLLAERLAAGEAGSLNETLRAFSEAAGLEAIYVMGLDGEVLAASNHATPASFLGQNYGFRPYFQGALAGRFDDYFAIGATTGRPGYFVAGPLTRASGAQVGVIAIKLDISELQTAWQGRGEEVLATNADGVVLLSSNTDWLYRTVGPLEPDRREAILESRQFADEPLSPLDWSTSDAGRVALEGTPYFRTEGQTDLVDWTVHYLTPVSAVRSEILMATAVLGAIIAGLIGFAVFLRSRRISTALAISQRRRTELALANTRLLEAQDELARTSKLAALGQLAASVTHELGQPISALKNHLVAADIGREITSDRTARNLMHLTERMEGITNQLRFFARRQHPELEAVAVDVAVAEAIALLRHDIEVAGVALHWSPPGTPHVVTGHKLQLEQGFTNLIRNAVQAAEGTQQASVRISVAGADSAEVRIDIADSGPGLNGLTLDQLQEPFFSTRSSGVGMGLGLAITAQILRDHGGRLTARNAEEQDGAIFSVHLPRRESEEGAS